MQGAFPQLPWWITSGTVDRDLNEVEVGIAHVHRAHRSHRAGLRHRPFEDLDFQRTQLLDDFFQGHRSDEAQIQRPRHRDVRARLELAAPFVQVDLLGAELEREALLGRRAELLQLHAEHVRVKPDAGVPVPRREDDVIDMVDHFLSNFERARSKASCMPLNAVSAPRIISDQASPVALCTLRIWASASSRRFSNCSSWRAYSAFIPACASFAFASQRAVSAFHWSSWLFSFATYSSRFIMIAPSGIGPPILSRCFDTKCSGRTAWKRAQQRPTLIPQHTPGSLAPPSPGCSGGLRPAHFYSAVCGASCAAPR